MRAPAGPAAAEVRVWDPLVRLFHWSLVAAFFTAFLAEEGETLHDMAGYVVLGLIGFRLVWGFVGGHWSRFAQFLYSPKTIWAYARSQSHAQERPGHNPLVLFRCGRSCCSCCCKWPQAS